MKLALPSLRDGCGGFNSAESILCTHLKCEASIPYLTKVEGTYADSTPYSNEVGVSWILHSQDIPTHILGGTVLIVKVCLIH